ncbi:ParB/RepB/Spo0J family partition protein [Nocardia otitidiscaviarum]|uniref:ParB/RepB/Spo0J family partition protein n=1 Tax=Nocardia otitidiscaviarum TaxID=1823 RepID=UPI0004A7171D|nr:ParB/RepB/Spo0J family partition protein [Nocardia otitidiscaviarum]MBF6137826.1 ParB/RepB/Spo0J family partition protein [Nocardia otitidiscaviarum]MBF6485349.1 ParB/RepB/Spo0J family partition protein [Nocardia otitidiscaviarum]
MARGGRADFSDLVDSTGENSPVDGRKAPPRSSALSGRSSKDEWDQTPVRDGRALEIALKDLVANPLNPREIVKVDDLASIAEIQLQPVLIVDREAFLKLWPELESELGSAKYVVINGCRRLQAAHEFGRTTLEVVIKNEVAASRATLRAASLRENVQRENLDVLDEAKGVQALVADCEGNGAAAGRQLGKTKMWVSQRLALLKLTPELQAKLRAGELAVREARELGRVPAEEQVARWEAQFKKVVEGESEESAKPAPSRRGIDAVKIAKTFKKWGVGTSLLAPALYAHLDQSGVHELIEELKQIATQREDA